MPTEKRYACDDCEKQFVRPEHLYRHRLNHRPKRIYNCSSCSKTFVRRDLLNRHEKRHEQGMPGQIGRSSSLVSSTVADTPSEPHSASSHGPTPGPSIMPRSTPLMSNPTPETTQLFFDSSTDVQGVREDIDWLFSNGNVPESAADGYYNAAPWAPPPPLSLSPSSSNSFQSAGDVPNPQPSEWNEVRANVLSALDLILPPPVLQSSFFEPESLQTFYGIYFANYNAHFPILHAPTFNPQEAPPLLMVAILTLGATLSPDETHFSTADKIHDSLRWLIFSSEAFRPPAPLWCLQALLLAQAQEKMFSSRKHHEMAHIFHGAIITLMRRGSSYTSDRAMPPESSSLEKGWRSWIDRELGLRAAYFAFIMDAQHASIFGHTPALSVSDIRLPLPCPDRLWEATTASRWKREQARPEEMPEFLPTLRAVLARSPLPSTFCAFSRFIILHGLFSLAKHMEARELTSIDVGSHPLSLEDNRSNHSSNSESGDGWRETLDRAIETWSYSLMSQEASLCLEAARTLQRIAHIVLHVNLIDFHVLAGALTGAPSLTGSERTAAEYARSKHRIEHWTKKPVAKRTLSHCFMLVQETLFSRRQYQAAEDNIALRPWCLYNATLIIWSWGMLTQGKSSMPILSAEEYITHMMSSLRSAVGSQSLPGANRTDGLVVSVRRSLANCRWELLQEAFVTLGKLLEIDTEVVHRS
ncbi:uncharacterized protein HMPREF1541_00586 [Cyphellophora europaea CBS 101466]|uniref:C2H2-type domain-containing protein n=1 Tax=Cyphellophora europaea (strain CBS 101466) TaxID=1220924 RepID=W2SCJ4_CYPE1|nr:uncharacterized protein HMPREF1541_00586 [Cyphellophora europaea CBS 101466]ETN46402.1 hypothetical protein HMPREF1541_00586 [Cyphellophora europaea CBS 101466]